MIFKNKRLLVSALLVAVLYLVFNTPLLHFLTTPPQDKVIHAALSFILALLLSWNLDMSPIRTFALVALIGGLDEWLQIFLPDRSADLDDFLANLAGAALA
jgi:VanZ family protein